MSKQESNSLVLDQFTESETVRHCLSPRGEMAQQGIQLDEVKFCCSICLDLLKDPVAIPCGHSYCMSCIKRCWHEENERKIYSCPQCRQIFTSRPVLMKNTMLANLVEEMKKTEDHPAPADHCYAEPGDVGCDFCTGRKRKASKSCLQCLASYCEQHLQPHYDVPPLKKHKLIEASAKLQENICSRHDEVMKLFCRTDQQCICYLCSVDEHKGHDTVSAAAEMTEKKRELVASRQNIHIRILNIKTEVKNLQQEAKAINHSANKAVTDNEKVFRQLIRLMIKRSSEVKQQIRSQQETEVSRIEKLQEKLEKEITDLRRKDDELQQLSITDDHTQFLQNFPSMSCLSESTDSASNETRPPTYFEDVTAAVTKLRDKLQNILSEEWTKISVELNKMDVLLPSEPKTRPEFLKYSRHITLDPNTANLRVSLSKGNRKATLTSEHQLYSGHPDRFTYYQQVLSRESLTGRCYWEVEWSGAGVSVAVAYKDIERTGNSNDCAFGQNDKSWALYCHRNGIVFRHNNSTTFSSGPQSSRVGVYLDHSAGVLSFYRISKTMTLIHRVQTAFTQPLYAGLWLSNYSGDTAELCSSR